MKKTAEGSQGAEASAVHLFFRYKKKGYFVTFTDSVS